MSQNHEYLGMDHDPKLKLRGYVLMLQLKGAGYAAIFCLALALSVWALYAIGKLLPEESRQAPDPNLSYHLLVDDSVTTV